MRHFSRVSIFLIIGLLLSAAFVRQATAQSTEISFPTAITENQLAGRIKARDIGDPRLTTYYYTFNGIQGDLFINVVTKNLSGTVDVFAADDMRQLTKILVYADLGDSETGRVIYLRKPEKLILRIQGRTPNDDPAVFQIKFAGGFEAAVPTRDEPPVPKVTDAGTNDSGIKVNSAGTIIATVPNPKPTPSPVESAIAEKRDEKDERTANEPRPDDSTSKAEAETAVTKPASRPEKPVTTPKKQRPTRDRPTQVPLAVGRGTELKPETVTAPEDEPPPKPTRRKPPKVLASDDIPKTETPTVNPLANVRLVITFKDGRKVERPMTEVLRFTADQTTLTVISTNGRVAKFPILDVASVNIQ
jgi:hypothetical protein